MATEAKIQRAKVGDEAFAYEKLRYELWRTGDLNVYWLESKKQVSFRRGDGGGKQPTIGSVFVGRYDSKGLQYFLDDLAEVRRSKP